jgi:hypothetical protein
MTRSPKSTSAPWLETLWARIKPRNLSADTFTRHILNCERRCTVLRSNRLSATSMSTKTTSIVDFKSTARAQDEDVTRDQLHVYVVGYQELTGERADLIEVLNLDQEGKTSREVVDDPLLVEVRDHIKSAGDALRDNDLPRLPTWGDQCAKCDLAEL